MSHRLQVLISEELDMRLSQAANRQDLSKGAFVRSAIEEALASQMDSPDPLKELRSLEAPTADVDQMLVEIERGRR